MIRSVQISVNTQLPLASIDRISTSSRSHQFDNSQTGLQRLLEIIAMLEQETIMLSLVITFEITHAFHAGNRPIAEDKQSELLTKREKEVLKLMVDGFTNKEIAQQLFISFETVKTHRKNILSKTGSKNTAALTKNLKLSDIEELKK